MKSSGFTKTSGFTLVELIVVMMIVGILAVFAIPRLLDTRTFDARSFHDQTLAALRYAQKAAIAQRRTVCAGFSSNSVTLTLVALAGSSDCSTATGLAGPTGSSPFVVTAPAGVTFSASATPVNFRFNALGQASAGQTFQVSGAANTITVVQETGYVR